MGKYILFFFMASIFGSHAQQITLRKGMVMDSVPVQDSIPESFSVFLPTTFDMEKNWPVLFIFDLKGKGRQALRMYKEAAEAQGYILVASNQVADSLSTSQNILITVRMMNTVVKLLPLHKNRMYAAGFGKGAEFASILPFFVKGISGVISSGAAYPNLEVLGPDQSFYWIGIVGKGDYAYPVMLSARTLFNKLKIPNNLLLFDGGHEWPGTPYLKEAMKLFTLSSMAKGEIGKEADYIDSAYGQDLALLNRLVGEGKLLQADNFIDVGLLAYRPHKDLDSLKEWKRQLKKDKTYKTLQRQEYSARQKEFLIKEDYTYYLEEDLATHNYKNLGWWVYQMEELKKYGNSKLLAEQQMGQRLLGFLNAMIEEGAEQLETEKQVDQEALSLLWMMKTIVAPQEYGYYLKIISNSARQEDFATSLFYLEELLKNGYTDKEQLYTLDHTALLRITPEFNQIVGKYLKSARYEEVTD